MFETFSLLTLQQYWWFLVSLLGALFVFITFVQGGQTLLYKIAKTEKERDVLVASLGRKWELSFTALVMFGGGWKGYANKQIPKEELFSLINEYLGIDLKRIRDAYGSVEHSIPYIECENHNLHVPVYSRLYIRDVKSLEVLGLRGKIAIIGIAKRLEEIYYPEDPIPMYLDKKSETLKIIQFLRNEAHRFGITFHRNKRSKSKNRNRL